MTQNKLPREMADGNIPECQRKCLGAQCFHCGLNPTVSKVRKARIRAGEMIENDKGLLYLPLHDGL